MTDVPEGLVLLHGARGYIGVRDWRRHRTRQVLDTKGIERFDVAFDTQEARDGFNNVVSGILEKPLEDLDEGEHPQIPQVEPEAPVRPSVCVFRLEADGPFYVARDLVELLSLVPAREGVYVFGDGALLDSFHQNYPDQYINPDLLDQVGLRPVHSSVTVTKDVLEDDEVGNSAGYGQSADYGSSSADAGD